MTNYSLIPQEMLACGLPCVDLAGFSAETVFGADGPVELAPFDPVALADALERLLDDEALWQRRSDEGRAFVADRTWDRAAEQLEDGPADGAARARARRGRRACEPAAPRGSRRSRRRAASSRARVPVEIFGARPATERLLARLAPEDIAAVEAALERRRRRGRETAGPENRARARRWRFGVWHRVPAVLEKTGLRPDEPPEHVHAMARGPLAAGGGYYEADMIVEALELRGRLDGDVRRGAGLRLLVGTRRARAGGRLSRRSSGSASTRTPRRSPGRASTCPRWRSTSRPATRRSPTTTGSLDLVVRDLDLVALRRDRGAALARRDAPRARARAAISC